MKCGFSFLFPSLFNFSNLYGPPFIFGRRPAAAAVQKDVKNKNKRMGAAKEIEKQNSKGKINAAPVKIETNYPRPT